MRKQEDIFTRLNFLVSNVFATLINRRCSDGFHGTGTVVLKRETTNGKRDYKR